MARTPQLALRFPHQPGYAAQDFIVSESNRAAWTWISRTDDWPDRRLLIWGEVGCGKTHLLQVWSRRIGARYAHGADLTGMPPLPGSAGIAIDDADRCPHETALLHLLNICRERGIPVLLAARQSPSRWTVGLPDLASRLRAILAVEVSQPDEPMLLQLVVRLLAERQLAFAPGLPTWLVRHVERSADALRRAVDQLDHAALAAAQGPITPIFAGKVLGPGADASPDSRLA